MIKILASTDSLDEELEKYRPPESEAQWNLVLGGYWEQGAYHSGYVAYYLCQTESDNWVLDSVTRNACLDDVTEEDVEEGALNDDQIQALWGTTLDEAQNREYAQIVAVALGVAEPVSEKRVARLLYDAVCLTGGKRITEELECGLIDRG